MAHLLNKSYTGEELQKIVSTTTGEGLLGIGQLPVRYELVNTGTYDTIGAETIKGKKVRVGINRNKVNSTKVTTEGSASGEQTILIDEVETDNKDMYECNMTVSDELLADAVDTIGSLEEYSLKVLGGYVKFTLGEEIIKGTGGIKGITEDADFISNAVTGESIGVLSYDDILKAYLKLIPAARTEDPIVYLSTKGYSDLLLAKGGQGQYIGNVKVNFQYVECEHLDSTNFDAVVGLPHIGYLLGETPGADLVIDRLASTREYFCSYRKQCAGEMVSNGYLVGIEKKV